MNKTIRTSLVVLTLLILSGCSSEPIKEQQEPGSTVAEQSGAHTSDLPAQGGYTAADLNDPTSPLYQRTIYFDYDSSEIRPQFIDILRAHASYLSSNPTLSVTLDGHTDERGTREYNLALGDHRAQTVASFLRAEGVPDGRIRTMSYGEERPADPRHSEAAWELNRRVELVY